LHDFDAYIFSYDLFKLYARISLMLFIAPLMNFSLSTSTPWGFDLMSSTPGVMDVNLGNCLLGVLDLILCRSLNSNFENNLNLQTCLGQKLIFDILDL
jgi:hypothetical protein